jgi:hypothetical protein
MIRRGRLIPDAAMRLPVVFLKGYGALRNRAAPVDVDFKVDGMRLRFTHGLYGISMIVRYLDLETGRKAEDRGLSEFRLTEGNWSCDCNRRIPFDGVSGADTCDGCHRFIVYDVEAEDGDEPFSAVDVIREANSEYYMRLRAV